MKIKQFRERFRSGFSKPKLHAERIWEFYTDLEIVADALAGPFYTISIRGNCDYVYRDKEGRFPGVTNADTFRKWALNLAEKYKKEVGVFISENETEESGRKELLKRANTMIELVEFAYQIQKSRE